ncbi:MAG: helix-turn-helix transcriptional regulator [Rhodoferax sp.]|nr:helix-turn-helix transcriptional regulator [Rhodoferax sp.]
MPWRWAACACHSTAPCRRRCKTSSRSDAGSKAACPGIAKIEFFHTTINDKCVNKCVLLTSPCLDTSAVTKNEINYKELVGKKVRRLRLQADFSQETLAERCGIFRTYLSRIESGSANPSIVVLAALANALGVLPHELFMLD